MFTTFVLLTNSSKRKRERRERENERAMKHAREEGGRYLGREIKRKRNSGNKKRFSSQREHADKEIKRGAPARAREREREREKVREISRARP